jgi:transcriptional regulator with XRE-family HTH domain
MHSMPRIGELVAAGRRERKWSLRQLAAELGVTPAYVADLEADRRLPSAELMGRISTVLAISLENLAAADSRLSTELREWIEERPQLTALLRSLRTSPESDLLIQRLTRLINRRARPQIPKGLLVTWESELRAIAVEASAWSIETGGDLFGRWQDVPTVFLATKAGPAAQRNHAHFRLDVDYLRDLSETLATTWGLRYFGDWHSHHRLGLSAPSGGDRRRIVSIAQRNQFPAMSEIIVTLEESRGEPTIRIHPWLYDLAGEVNNPFPLEIKVLPGISPVREALLARRVLPEQTLAAWEGMPLQRIRIGADSAPPTLEPTRDVDGATRERVLRHLVQALQEASGGPIEQHVTGFGCVLVAPLDGSRHLAFALASAWPMGVLEVHRLNRDTGTTEPFDQPAGLTAIDVPRAIEIYRAAKQAGETQHVDV